MKKILMVGDPNLGPAGQELVREYFPVQTLIWQKGDKTGKNECQKTIRSQRWEIVILFYCDLLLKMQDLVQMDLVLNIHPASPEFPGVGYDVMPLIYEKQHHEATMHFVTDESVDRGSIIEVIQRPLPPDADYSYLREANQRLCLFQLEGLAQRISQHRNLCSLRNGLDAQSRLTNRTWSEEEYRQERVNNELLRLWESGQTDHPVFKGNKRFEGFLEGLKNSRK